MCMVLNKTKSAFYCDINILRGYFNNNNKYIIRILLYTLKRFYCYIVN